jgi:hypothetical protein
MTIKRVVSACILCTALGGCMTAQERLASDQQTCVGYGFRPGTEAFAQCMMNIDQGRRNRLAAAAAANLASPSMCTVNGNTVNCY